MAVVTHALLPGLMRPMVGSFLGGAVARTSHPWLTDRVFSFPRHGQLPLPSPQRCYGCGRRQAQSGWSAGIKLRALGYGW